MILVLPDQFVKATARLCGRDGTTNKGHRVRPWTKTRKLHKRAVQVWYAYVDVALAMRNACSMCESRNWSCRNITSGR